MRFECFGLTSYFTSSDFLILIYVIIYVIVYSDYTPFHQDLSDLLGRVVSWIVFWYCWGEYGYAELRKQILIREISWWKRVVVNLISALTFQLTVNLLGSINPFLSVLAVFLLYLNIEAMLAQTKTSQSMDMVDQFINSTYKAIGPAITGARMIFGRLVKILIFAGISLYFWFAVLQIFLQNVQPILAKWLILLAGLIALAVIYFVARQSLVSLYLRNLQANLEYSDRALDTYFKQLENIRSASMTSARGNGAACKLQQLYEI